MPGLFFSKIGIASDLPHGFPFCLFLWKPELIPHKFHSGDFCLKTSISVFFFHFLGWCCFDQYMLYFEIAHEHCWPPMDCTLPRGYHHDLICSQKSLQNDQSQNIAIFRVFLQNTPTRCNGYIVWNFLRTPWGPLYQAWLNLGCAFSLWCHKLAKYLENYPNPTGFLPWSWTIPAVRCSIAWEHKKTQWIGGEKPIRLLFSSNQIVFNPYQLYSRQNFDFDES